MRLQALLATVAGGMIVVGLQAQPAAAAAVQGFSGHAESSVPGCPYLAWRLVKHDNGDITGIAYYSDLSGLSTVKGTSTSSGQFHLVLTPELGHGPSGTVDGTRSSRGAVVATMKGEGCANMRLTMMPLTDVNHWTNAGGGAG